jgi:hypothetical protein
MQLEQPEHAEASVFHTLDSEHREGQEKSSFDVPM